MPCAPPTPNLRGIFPLWRRPEKKLYIFHTLLTTKILSFVHSTAGNQVSTPGVSLIEPHGTWFVKLHHAHTRPRNQHHHIQQHQDRVHKGHHQRHDSSDLQTAQYYHHQPKPEMQGLMARRRQCNQPAPGHKPAAQPAPGHQPAAQQLHACRCSRQLAEADCLCPRTPLLHLNTTCHHLWPCVTAAELSFALLHSSVK